MFGWWRRKSDGFEWQEYVRTTIKLRREDRARKIEEIKHAAASGAKAAGRQSVSAGRSGFGLLLAGIERGARWLWAGLVRGFMYVRMSIGALISNPSRFKNIRLPSTRISAGTKIAAMFGGLGLLAGLSAYLQFQQSGADWSAMLASLVAVVLLGLAVAPWLKRMWQTGRHNLSFKGMRLKMPALGSALRPGSMPASMPGPARMGAIASVVLAVGAGVWAWQSGAVSTVTSSVVSALPSWSSLSSVTGSSSLPDISGAGRAVSGDTVRIGGRLVRLAGIEAPEISQVCRDKRKRAWRCGQRARNVLRRVIGKRKVTCTGVTSAEGGRFRATCQTAKSDIASELVKKGYAFAEGTIFKTYADAETEAREAKRGIWQGKAQRPADFRAKRWASASKSAPDGCPIKGRVVRRAKVYVLPWALDYRQVRFRSRRGERWFCSEADATDAGFKPSTTG